MTTLRQAAQAALEALELGYESARSEAAQYHDAMAGYRPQRHAQMDADVQQIAAAIADLRAALAAEPEPQYRCHIDCFDGQEPDECVIDTGQHENCLYARKYGDKGRDHCGEWKPITIHDANERGNTLTPARIERIMALAGQYAKAMLWDFAAVKGARAALLAELEDGG